ncbi:MAG: hypothetical protein CBC09_00445 [Cellvibrionales bacterium TMED49]|uniref:DUF35 domain-containing protein n=1 Tax=PS1 clade bacterium TaxID=2175152 RepID=A0A368DRC2_9PROT|nr:hypothetical protein [Rhodobiaceae bacterium]MAU86840.1 hypothetical protein [Rhodobiaceae bacterium]OUT75049.1 MAG: hypothetical protein CBB85_03385 [Rhizobiales bacterium TMED25]OUU40461.1 MAG: hypothetical protein CBC09_00445 [Cellvibrionales bacterium TMED49]RCL74402.1 MAG: hypothetical protein DBW71_01365 [PS1 clade bacterium]|tara:strand:- start:2153 stop:2458 length:306 start_codon:yes stop_codon:yes gene_type:complete
MEKLQFYRCNRCNKCTFPKKFICSKCGNTVFNLIDAPEGQVKEISVIRHMLGHKDWHPRKIANIQTNTGVSLTVGIDDDIQVGDIVNIYINDGAPVGKNKY